jgi:hypothetical protein
MAVKTAIINGTPYITPLNVNSGKSLGNTSKMTYVVEVEKKELPNNQGGGGNDDVFYLFKSGRVSLDCRHVTQAMLEIALGATATAEAVAPVAAEPHTVVALDELIELNHMQDLAVALTVTDVGAVVTYVEGTDYIRKRAGIIPITGGAIAAAASLEISYTKHKHVVFQALVNLIKETGLLFDGNNERSGNPWLGKWHRIGWGVSPTIDFIGNDFINFAIEGEILDADFITGVGLSKVLALKVGDL